MKDGKRASLLLDYYPPLVNPQSGKKTRFQFTGLFVYIKPTNPGERNHNRETWQQAEAVRAQRQLDVQAGQTGFLNPRQDDCFVEFMADLGRERATAKTRLSWAAAAKHFREFAKGKPIRFSELSIGHLDRFLAFLRKQPGVGANTAHLYHSKAKAALREAYRQDLTSVDPAKAKAAPKEQAQKTYLTLAELQQLKATPLEPERLKEACLFSALTGLRASDLFALKYGDFGTDGGGLPTIALRMKKTKGVLTNPISQQARELAGEGAPADRVFPFLADTRTRDKVAAWARAAGIAKKVGFHTFRHSYATTQLTAGTDIATVSKMMGHANISQTMTYARVVDQAKRDAAERVKI